jgi:hypothetical protein
VYLPLTISCIKYLYTYGDFHMCWHHFCQDIPALAAEASKEHSNIPYIVTAPLGLHELMVVCVHSVPYGLFLLYPVTG